MLCRESLTLLPFPPTARRCRNLPSGGTPPCVVPFLGEEEGKTEEKKKWGPSCCHTPGQTMMMTMLHLPTLPSLPLTFFSPPLEERAHTQRKPVYCFWLPLLTFFVLFLLLLVFVALPLLNLLEHCYSLFFVFLCMIGAYAFVRETTSASNLSLSLYFLCRKHGASVTFLEFKPRRALRPSFKPVISLSLLCCHWFVNKRVPNEKKGKGTDVGMCIACHLHEGCRFSQVWGKVCGAVCLLLVDCACPSKEAQHFREERRKMGPPLFALCAAVFFTDAMPFARGRWLQVPFLPSSLFSSPNFVSPHVLSLSTVPLVFTLLSSSSLFACSSSSFVRSLPSQLFFVYIGNTA